MGKGSEADRIAALVDAEGDTIFYDEDDIAKIRRVGGSAAFLEELIAVDDGANPIFDNAGAIIQFLKYGGTLDIAEELGGLHNHDGETIFSQFTLAEYVKNKGTVAFAQELTRITNSYGETLFAHAQDINDFRRYSKKHKQHYFRTVKKAQKYADLRNHNNTSLFESARDIIQYLDGGGTYKKIDEYRAIKKPNGAPLCSGNDIAVLQQHAVSLDYLEEMAHYDLNARTILYHYELDLDEGDLEFRNDGRPKALIIYPTDDPYEDSSYAFTDEDAFEFLTHFPPVYDLKLRAVSSPEELFAFMKQSTNIDLLMIGGHGQQDEITLGSPLRDTSTQYFDQMRKFTIAHRNFARHVSGLKSDATIYLDACFCGEGRDNKSNLANSVARWAPGRTVVSCTGLLDNRYVTIKSLHPLRVEMKLDGETDSCYEVTKGAEENGNTIGSR